MFESTSSLFRAARIGSALQEKFLGARSAAAQYRRFAVYLDSGQAVVQGRQRDYDLIGPALHWGPLYPETRIKVAAGSTGHYVFLSDLVLDDAIGAVAEAAELRVFSHQHIGASFARSDAMAIRLDGLFSRITEEASDHQFGAEVAVSAYLRLLLILLWRHVDREQGTPVAIGHSREQINRFRNLVEAHFRTRWPAKRYAEALGMSYDRLHDLCARSVGKPPAQLIRERSLHEARMLLQRTTLSAERIAAMLGFSSASQFNHFFKALTDETPGTFRKRSADRAGLSDDGRAQFSEWP